MRGKTWQWVVGTKLSIAALVMLLTIARTNAQAVTGLDAVRVASGLPLPVFLTAPPGDYNRAFIVAKTGQVYILNLSTGTLNGTTFLDISAQITTAGEAGLLGLAFDPNYATNGKFYLDFVVPGGAWSHGVTHVSQFKVSANPDVADTSEEKVLVTFDQPSSSFNHKAGWIAFSPRTGDENNLYIATGDGGDGNDAGTGHIEPGGNAQSLATLLGKILRIHIDPIAGTASAPSNNPFVAVAGARAEIFAYGLRNPFRDSFDRVTGDLFIGDVGQGSREEIDVQKTASSSGGENYGWRVREGMIQNPQYPDDMPPENAVNPILDFTRDIATTITGGYVYRGKQIPALRGTYVFGDFSQNTVFSMNYDGTSAFNFQDVRGDLFPTASGNFDLSGPSSFGEDANGELYIVSYSDGSIFKIVPTTPNVGPVSVAQQGANMVVSTSGVPFKTHNVLAANNLTDTFQQVGTANAGGDGSLQFVDANPGTQRFYRFTYP